MKRTVLLQLCAVQKVTALLLAYPGLLLTEFPVFWAGRQVQASHDRLQIA